MSDLRERAVSILNGATGGRESWSKWDRDVFDVIDEAADEIERLSAAKTAALKIADERAIEAVELRAKLERARKALEEGVKNSMSEEQWPPNSGVPEKKRFKKARKLEWGETPFDDLSRADLLRLVQAYHSATVSAHSVMAMMSEAAPQPYWGREGSGGRALAKAKHLMHLAGEQDPDPASERIYRSFFRTADALLFPYLKEVDKWNDWGVNEQGEMCAPRRQEEGWRPIEWRDVLPLTS